MTSGQRRRQGGRPLLEAPHRRLETRHRPLRRASRPFEKAVVVGYRAASAVLGRLPAAAGAAVIGRGAQLAYLAWPAKRRVSNANFGHVLGLPPDHPEVRRLALAAYAEFGRYLVDVMRLARLDGAAARTLVPEADFDGFGRFREANPGGLILTAAHVGNNEVVALAVASRRWPISVLADDSTYPELFEDFRRQRAAWGVRVIPWRNIREVYRVLERGEILALLVDWGYRPEGIPVRLFGAWTTLPSGPATLAAKTGSPIVHVSIRRRPDGTHHAEYSAPIRVASTDPAELQRATQALATALEAAIAAAPEQWHSFKPLWPDSADEAAELERRAIAASRGSAAIESGSTPEPGTTLESGTAFEAGTA